MSETKALLLMSAVILLAFFLRVHRLEDKNVWWDEGLAIWAARKDLVSISLWTAGDVHPPFYFWLLHYWVKLVGESEFAARFLSLLWGVLSVALIYPMAKRLINRPAGMLAAILMATARFHIWWSQEMRMYILATFLALLSLHFFIQLPKGDKKIWLFYILATTAGLYTLYLVILVILIENLFILLTRRSRSFMLRWVLSQMTVLFLFAPWLYLALAHMRTWSVSTPFDLSSLLRLYWLLLPLGISIHIERYTWLALGYFLISAVGLVLLRHKEEAGLLLLLSLALPPLAVYLISLPRGFFYTPRVEARYFILFAPSFYILMACGLAFAGSKSRFFGILTSLFVLLSFGWTLREYYAARWPSDEYQSLSATLRAYRRPNDAVVLHTDQPWPVFDYYAKVPWHGIPNAMRLTPEATEGLLAPIWEKSEGLWLVLNKDARRIDPQGYVEGWLSERALAMETFHFVSSELQFYARTPTRAQTAGTLSAGFFIPNAMAVPMGDGLQLLGYEQALSRFRSGDTVHVFLYWKVESTELDDQVQTEVSLVNEAGQAFATAQGCIHADCACRDGLLREQYDLLISPDIPTGRYSFLVRVSDGDREVHLGKVEVAQLERPAPVTGEEIAHPRWIALGEEVLFLGYDLDSTVHHAGDALRLTLYWQAQIPIKRRYVVFTHLLGEVYNADSGNFIWGQQDSEPLSGNFPTTMWKPGELVMDEYLIKISPLAPPGRYILEIGMYEPLSGQRLPTFDEQGNPLGDNIVLGEIQVVVESGR